MRVAHHRAGAVVYLKFFAGCSLDDCARFPTWAYGVAYAPIVCSHWRAQRIQPASHLRRAPAQCPSFMTGGSRVTEHASCRYGRPRRPAAYWGAPGYRQPPFSGSCAGCPLVFSSYRVVPRRALEPVLGESGQFAYVTGFPRPARFRGAPGCSDHCHGFAQFALFHGGFMATAIASASCRQWDCSAASCFLPAAVRR